LSIPDHLQAALTKVVELEAELSQWNAADPEEDAARDRAQSEVADLKRALEEAQQEHSSTTEAQRARDLAQIEVGAQSTRAQIERARIQGELQTVQLRAQLVEQDQETYLERLNALASELSEEIDILLSFSRERAASYYAARVERETEALERAEAAHHDAQRTLKKREAEARATGQRTIAKIQELDKAIEVARLEANAAGVAARDAKTRLELLQQKLERCSRSEPTAG
jgi:chromosome segregation ATPase